MMQPIGCGSEADVFMISGTTRLGGYARYALKVFRPGRMLNVGAADAEYRALQTIAECLERSRGQVEYPIAVELFSASSAYLMTYVDGVPLNVRFRSKVNRGVIDAISSRVGHAMRDLEQVGYPELIGDFHPGNILITSSGIAIIDLGTNNPIYRQIMIDVGCTLSEADLGYWVFHVSAGSTRRALRRPILDRQLRELSIRVLELTVVLGLVEPRMVRRVVGAHFDRIRSRKGFGIRDSFVARNGRRVARSMLDEAESWLV